MALIHAISYVISVSSGGLLKSLYKTDRRASDVYFKPAMEIEIIELQHSLFPDVVILGKQNAKTLGMFPEGAFADHARKRFIFGAVQERKLIGYILFRITRSKGFVCIAHLCVKPEFRGGGIAKALLDAVKAKYSSTQKGISLSCRSDYKEASKFWEKYGFKAMRSTRSRSIEEKYLVKWWLDFGNSDLFSSSVATSSRVCACLDANVIMKMSDKSESEDFEATALAADWLTDEADYYCVPEIFNEINRDKDLIRADVTRRFVHTLHRAQVNQAKADEVAKELYALLPGTTDNHRSDRRQLAESIAAGIEYFITLDYELLGIAELVQDKYGLKVLRPADFILFIDHDTNGRDYRAYRLTSPSYAIGNLQQSEIELLIGQDWLYHSQGEKSHLLKAKLTALVADLKNTVIRVVKDKDDCRLAYVGFVVTEGKLIVKLIRIINVSLASILFQQLIRDVIEFALKRRVMLTIIEDYIVEEGRKQILNSYGFVANGSDWTKVHLAGQFDLQDIATHPVIGQHLDVEAMIKKTASLIGTAKDLYLFEFEKKLWPAKINDLDLPTYIVPIRPHWASQLFDHHLAAITIFGADPLLTWNRENIYYRSIKPVSEIAPGRILWYVSSETKAVSGRDKSIVAVSYLDEVHTGTAKSLFKKFRHYGIYEWRDIYALAKQNAMAPIKALKFTDTEVFEKPVFLTAVQQVFRACGQRTNTFASPVKVSSEIFHQIYRLGKQ